MSVNLRYLKKLSILLVILTVVSTVPIYAKKSDVYVKKIPYRFDAKPSWVGNPKEDKESATLQILNVPDDATVMNGVIVIVEAKGAAEVLLGTESMTSVGYGDRYSGTWTFSGSPVIEVTALDSEGSEIASDAVNVNIVSTTQWNIYLEIDWIDGHKPTTSTLNYLKSYMQGFAIDLEYSISDDPVNDPTPGDGYISDNDFWNIERVHNEVLWHNDLAQDGEDSDKYGYDAEYMSPEKWVLWGSRDSNQYVGGYTYVIMSRKDGLAGNYVFIADSMINQWEANNGISEGNGEVIVLCHEIGHSLGILKLRGSSEKYDPDYYSIMSTMRIENAQYMQGAWYYSSEYWDTINLEYY